MVPDTSVSQCETREAPTRWDTSDVTPLAIPVDAQLSGETPQEIVAFAVAAEVAGFARLWAPELTRSAMIPLALAAASTSRIELATGIALAFTRSPFTLALEMLDLDELSGGRMALGLGAGVKRLNERWHGVAYDPPIRRMRETVAAVRELIRTMPEEGPSRAHGRIVDIEVAGYQRAFRAPRTAIPVWLAATTPSSSMWTTAPPLSCRRKTRASTTGTVSTSSPARSGPAERSPFGPRAKSPALSASFPAPVSRPRASPRKPTNAPSAPRT